MNKLHHEPLAKGAAYPREFREESVQYWISSGQKVDVIAQESGVSDWSLLQWRKESEQANTPSNGAGEFNALELAREKGRLRCENEALLRQRETLKSHCDLLDCPAERFEIVEVFTAFASASTPSTVNILSQMFK